MAEESDKQISASEVATYVVCPEAWRLKRIHRMRKRKEEPELTSRRIRGAWLKEQDISARLRHYAKIAYLLLVLVVIAIFLLDQARALKSKKQHVPSAEAPSAAAPAEAPAEVPAPDVPAPDNSPTEHE